MRINQQLAKEISVKMTEKKSAIVTKLQNDYKDFVYAEYVKQTPKMMVDALKKHPEWVSVTNTIRFDGFGFSTESISTNKAVINNTSNYYAQLIIDKDLAFKLKSLKDKCIDAKKKYTDLREKIETALNSLRTFAQIQKHLPEAVPFFPTSTSLALAVNFDVLRKEIATI